MHLCEACEEGEARSRSRFCSEKCRSRARRRWARGLPANAVRRQADVGELIREAALREGARSRSTFALADHLVALGNELGARATEVALGRAVEKSAA